MQAKILAVEDEPRLRDIVKDYFTAHGTACDLARDGEEALDILRDHDYDAILLDILMPNLDGFAVCRAVRAQSNIPILFLTALGGEEDALRGYALGGDDYITKPFSLAVLRARVNAQLRRQAGGEQDLVELDGFSFHFARMEFKKDGHPVELSKTEQKLLRLLVSNRGATLSRGTLVDRLWTDGAEYVEENALSVTIKRLRNKLEDNPSKPKYLKTVYGVGYTWAVK